MTQPDGMAEKLAREVTRRKQLQSELSKARRDLALRTAELDAIRSRAADADQRLRRIEASGSYRLASRLWQVRRRALARVTGKGRSDPTNGEGVYAAGVAELGGPERPDAVAAQTDGVGSRSATESPVRAVWLLGGLTPKQLVRMVSAITRGAGDPARTLVISDCDAFRVLDGFGCLYEFIPPRVDWELRLGRDGGDYDGFVRRRLSTIAQTYGLPTLRPGEPIAPN
jgi:hypothetical protein